jgi:beta-lactamase superfamily II metal-dependent hydrolase
LELSPAQGKIDENPGSIMQVITLKDFQYLSMGDATSSKWKKDKPDTEMAMLAAGALPEGAKIDVLKVGHHGSDTSSGPDFVKAVSPKVAVISSAPTGHKLPKLTSIKALEECGAKVLVTGSARNAQGKFNEAKAEYDDGYKPTELMDKVGTITILVAKDGSRYTLRCEYKPDLVITNSARDN